MAKYLKHAISYGDTLQNIAQDMLSDSSRWIEIAMLNDLVFPFIVDDPSEKAEGVKTIGEIILVPQEGEQVDIIPRNEIQDIYEKALGEDLALFDDGGTITMANESGEFSSDVYGDLKTVVGLKNLRQAYLLRLSTPLGTLLHHPNYGSSIHELLGKRNTSGTLHKVKLEVERVIRSDARTADINFEYAGLINDTINMVLVIQPIGFDVAFKMSLAFGEGGLIEWA